MNENENRHFLACSAVVGRRRDSPETEGEDEEEVDRSRRRRRRMEGPIFKEKGEGAFGSLK